MKKNPIIFIPGLMGSIGGEMLDYKGEWGFGPATWFYNPFIRSLEKLGYTLNKDLFICYYDWRKDCRDIVKEFLYPLILYIERYHSNEKIDIICHSMGGLVARTYIQSEKFLYNIENLMLLGTPNSGNIEAYYLWTTGKVMQKSNKENEFFEIIKRGYVWLLSKILDIPLGIENINKLHSAFPGLGNLIPSNDYGYVLAYKDKNGKFSYIPREYMEYNNELLNQLNESMYNLVNRVDNIYSFIGTDNKTDEILILERAGISYKREYITGSITTMDGDGTVTVNSANINYGYRFLLEKGHSGILEGSIPYIAKIYNADQSLDVDNLEEFKKCPLSIILTKNIDMKLKNEINVIAKFEDGKLFTEYEFILHEFGKDFLWIMLKNVPIGNYIIETIIKSKEYSNIFVVGPRVEEELRRKNIKSKEKSEIFFSI